MAYLVRITARALNDLEHVYASIHADTNSRAFALFNGLSEAIFSLEHHPTRGAVTAESLAHRQILYGKKPHIYRIIYLVEHEEQAVQIVHLRHGARDAFDDEDLKSEEE